jgi:hypothetical protein
MSKLVGQLTPDELSTRRAKDRARVRRPRTPEQKSRASERNKARRARLLAADPELQKARERASNKKSYENRRASREANKEERSRRRRALYRADLEKARAYQKAWAARNPDKVRAKRSKWLEKNGDRWRDYMRQFRNTPSFKAGDAIRKSINNALFERQQRKTKFLHLLGCSIPEYRAYLEDKFTQGMSWDNYGHEGWHIDHIIPLSKFDLTREEDQRACFHYLNTQPLWGEDNWKKYNHTPDEDTHLLRKLAPRPGTPDRAMEAELV